MINVIVEFILVILLLGLAVDGLDLLQTFNFFLLDCVVVFQS